MTTNTNVKYQVLKAVEEMPQNVTFEEVMERLYFLYKVNQGLQQVDSGDTVSYRVRLKTYHEDRRGAGV